MRRPLLADWPKRDAMPMLDSAHARARRQAKSADNAESKVVVVVKAKMGVVVIVVSDVKILTIK